MQSELNEKRWLPYDVGQGEYVDGSRNISRCEDGKTGITDGLMSVAYWSAHKKNAFVKWNIYYMGNFIYHCTEGDHVNYPMPSTERRAMCMKVSGTHACSMPSSPAHHQQRLQWCCQYLHWRTQRKSIVFDDGRRFWLQAPDGHMRNRRLLIWQEYDKVSALLEFFWDVLDVSFTKMEIDFTCKHQRDIWVIADTHKPLTQSFLNSSETHKTCTLSPDVCKYYLLFLYITRVFIGYVKQHLKYK